MIFVVDEHMPRSLAELLRSLGHEAHHTFDMGLNAAPDQRVMEAATRLGAAIITKDSDFIALRGSPADPPIIWWRRGNESTKQTLDRCAEVLSEVLAKLSDGEVVVEVT